MKILYSIQATGNEHLARARELLPALQTMASVEVLVSGTQGDLELPTKVQFRKHGLSFAIGRSGKMDLRKTVQNLRPLQLWQDIRECPVEDYDLVIHDFEPITAYACKRKNVKNIALSHQASFFYLETPRPKNKNMCAEWLMRNYAPSPQRIGLHFRPYNKDIFSPVIRKEVRELKIEDQGHILVYLPSYNPFFLASIFQNIKDRRWKIFAKNMGVPVFLENVEIHPVSTDCWLENLRTANSVLCGAGCEGPSEVLFLGKKLLVSPMVNQYEQLCNAIALKQIGVPVLEKISMQKISEISSWLQDCQPVTISFPENTMKGVDHVLT